MNNHNIIVSLLLYYQHYRNYRIIYIFFNKIWYLFLYIFNVYGMFCNLCVPIFGYLTISEAPYLLITQTHILYKIKYYANRSSKVSFLHITTILSTDTILAVMSIVHLLLKLTIIYLQHGLFWQIMALNVYYRNNFNFKSRFISNFFLFIYYYYCLMFS